MIGVDRRMSSGLILCKTSSHALQETLRYSVVKIIKKVTQHAYYFYYILKNGLIRNDVSPSG